MIDWYDVEANGTVLTGGSATNSYTTPTLSTSATYYAQAKLSSDGCVSALPRTAVVATVIAYPVISTQPATSTSVCMGTAVTLKVVASPATAYQWKKNGANVTGGTSANYTTAAVTANATYSVVVGNAGACSTTSDNAPVSLKTAGCLDHVTGCSGFTFVSNTKSEGYMQSSDAITYCNAKANGPWRLPTVAELLCICSNKSQLQSGYHATSYWSISRFSTAGRYAIDFSNCAVLECGPLALEKEIKCVK
jgi:hypothetical protein